MLTTVYVLRCEGDHYYVGRTDRSVDDRYQEHLAGRGSKWTKKHPPFEIIQIIQSADQFDEDKVTKQYMQKYGIDKVRGGSYSQLTLPPSSLASLKKELCSASDQCFRCGQIGHYSNKCPNKKDEEGEDFSCGKCGKKYKTEGGLAQHQPKCEVNCRRCGRNTHKAKKCRALTHLDGRPLAKK
jgi:predicted GIY-YIG superfamily endonuclease